MKPRKAQVEQRANNVLSGDGGKPTLAQAGGKDVGKAGGALQIVPDLITERLV